MGKIVEWLKGLVEKAMPKVILFFKNHWVGILSLTFVSVSSYQIWMYYKNLNEVAAEIGKGIFMASIVGFFVELIANTTDEYKDIKDLIANKTMNGYKEIKLCLENKQSCNDWTVRLQQSQINNIFIPRSNDQKYDPVNEMKALINNTNEILWVKQVSLFALANNKGALYSELVKKYKSIKSIRFLLVDTQSDGAKMRAYREYYLDDLTPVINYTDFVDIKYTESPLYRDTEMSIINLNRMRSNYYIAFNEVEEDCEFLLKVFRSAPDAAIIITDDTVLFEPLHLGGLNEMLVKQPGGDSKPILSGHMPMFEFKKKDSPGIYELIKNNFQFVWDNYSENVP